MKKKYKDYIPKNDPELLSFLILYKKGFPELADATLPDMTPAQRTAHENRIQLEINLLLDVEYKRKSLAGAVKLKDDTKDEVVKEIRNIVNRSKTSSTPAPALIAGLRLFCSGQPVNEDELTPGITGQVVAGGVRINFQNHGLYGISVYCRLAGEADWQYVGCEVTSPFIDKRPLQVAFQPEKREYMAMYNNIRKDIGQMSKIIILVVG
jgi:hypothetical protein